MNDIKSKVEKYYTEKILKYGTTPQGVDWNSEASQYYRFEILSYLFKNDKDFTILDYGCGFGSFYEYLKSNHFDFSKFTGYDLSEEMIKQANKKYFGNEDCVWLTQLNQTKFDYVVSSGIFNVKNDIDKEIWNNYVLDTINEMNKISTKGFAFNILTSYSDKDYMKEYLYYADPMVLFEYCVKNFSKKVSILNDYPLYEFSIIVRK